MVRFCMMRDDLNEFKRSIEKAQLLAGSNYILPVMIFIVIFNIFISSLVILVGDAPHVLGYLMVSVLSPIYIRTVWSFRHILDIANRIRKCANGKESMYKDQVISDYDFAEIMKSRRFLGDDCSVLVVCCIVGVATVMLFILPLAFDLHLPPSLGYGLNAFVAMHYIIVLRALRGVLQHIDCGLIQKAENTLLKNVEQVESESKSGSEIAGGLPSKTAQQQSGSRSTDFEDGSSPDAGVASEEGAAGGEDQPHSDG